MIRTAIIERESELQKNGRQFDSEPDTQAEVNLDGIAGTDTSQQIQSPQQPSEGASGGMDDMDMGQPEDTPSPVPQDIPDTANDDPDALDKDSDIMSQLSNHPYIQLFDAQPDSKLNPMKIVNMDKTELASLKAKIDQVSMGHELRKKIGLYKDKQYKLITSLKSFITDVLSLK